MLDRIIELISDKQIDKEALIRLIPEIDACEHCECNHPAHIYNILDHSLESSKLVDDPILKLVMLFHDIGKPGSMHKDENGITRFWGHPELSVSIADKILDRLMIDENLKKEILVLIKYHDTKIEINKLPKYITLIGIDTVEKLIKVQKADVSTHSMGFKEKTMPHLIALESEYIRLRDKK